MAASVVAAASRTGCALVFLEIVLIPWLATRRGAVVTKRPLQLAGLVIAFGLVLILLVGWGPLRDRLEFLQSYFVRRDLLISSFRMFRDRPWFGFGLGNWPVIYPAYALYDDGTFVNQAHNDWMQWAVEGGLPFVVRSLRPSPHRWFAGLGDASGDLELSAFLLISSWITRFSKAHRWPAGF